LSEADICLRCAYSDNAEITRDRFDTPGMNFMGESPDTERCYYERWTVLLQALVAQLLISEYARRQRRELLELHEHYPRQISIRKNESMAKIAIARESHSCLEEPRLLKLLSMFTALCACPNNPIETRLVYG
jgi:hypothetical protein